MTGWELQGLAIKDYYDGDTTTELFVESDCAGVERMPVSIFFRNFEQLTDLDQYALSLCKGKVLDLGAGAGSHSLVLQRTGFFGLRHRYCGGCRRRSCGAGD